MAVPQAQVSRLSSAGWVPTEPTARDEQHGFAETRGASGGVSGGVSGGSAMYAGHGQDYCCRTWPHVNRSFSRSKPITARCWSSRRSPVSRSCSSVSSLQSSLMDPRRHLNCKFGSSKMNCLVKFRLEALSCSRKTRRSVGHLQRYPRTVSASAAAAASDDEPPSDLAGNAPTRGADVDNDDLASQKFIIIEGRDTVEDFAKLQWQEIAENISRRRNKIFLLMEEVRRLRIQQRLRKVENKINGHPDSEEDDMQEYPSSIPLLPPLTMNDLKLYYLTYFSLVALVIVFGGIFAPMLELKLGLGGTSYEDFIHSMHLPAQLSEVDPIVASFSGGAVGVISALMVVEVNNVKVQEQKKCKYCSGTGYLTCGRCAGSGTVLEAEATSIASGGDKVTTTSVINPRVQSRCSYCSGVGKVMCTSCLCTGRAMATEHDLRIDPFV